MIIPDELIIILAAIALMFAIIYPNITLGSRLAGFLSISIPMLVINSFVKDSFGGGDIKLISFCGFILGWQNTLLAFFISLITACAVALYLMANNKKGMKSHIPFGPHICIGVFIAYFYGSQIIKWYLSCFGL